METITGSTSRAATRRAATLLAFAIVAAGALSAVTPAGADDDSGSVVDLMIAAAGSEFTPGSHAAVVIEKGNGLSFTNLDVALHSVTSLDADASGQPLFDSGLASLGQTRAVAGVEDLGEGSYDFYCLIHPGMRGTLEVMDLI